MKLQLFILLGLLVLTQQSVLEKIKKFEKEGYDVLKHPHGHHQVKVSQDETLIISTGQDIREHPEFAQEYEEHIKQYNNAVREEVDILRCKKSKPLHTDFFKMLGWDMGVIGNTGNNASINLKTNEDSCFKLIQVNYTKTSDSSYTLQFHGSQPIGGFTCLNLIQITTASDFHLPVTMSALKKTHTLKYENQTPEQMEQVENWGIRIFQTCDQTVNLVGDLKKTASLFIGGLSDDPEGEGLYNSKPTPEQIEANVDFLKKGTGYQWEKRVNNFYVDLTEDQLNDGDLILIVRFDGVDQLISWGAGGRAGHTVTVLTIDGEKYIVESQDGWYWPKHGIQRNKWSQWSQWARNAGFNFIVVPLSDEKRALLQKNIDKAGDYFKSMEGLPYGYHNFLFGWLDDVNRNIPPVTTIDYIFVVFAQLEKTQPALVTRFMGEALNMRLGTKGLTLPQVATEVHKRNMTMAELFAIPEDDSWVYSDGPSRVCSSFVANIYKVAGLFGDYNVNTAEITPRDIYQLNFYNKDKKKVPRICQAYDPKLPYCQVNGNYTIDITTDLWNTVEPYEHMYERCPSEPPLYARDTSFPNGC